MSQTNKQIIGQQGENWACEYLITKGYKIIERNFLVPWGEIDIVAKNPDKILTFIEVKTLKENNSQNLTPEDQLSPSKLKKLIKTGEYYANKNPKLLTNKGWQIDLVAITIKSNYYLTDINNCYAIEHYKNISF